tara:strand:+ start:281 stop:628 length:348 start_codon:yes stop_codon:yes gene_type:complete
MKILLAPESQIKDIAERYIVLELDTFCIKGIDTPSWCVIEAGDIGLAELTELNHFITEHGNLIKNYKLGNFTYCEQMIEHLRGKFGGEVDSFYMELYARTQQPKTDPWNSVIVKE